MYHIFYFFCTKINEIRRFKGSLSINAEKSKEITQLTAHSNKLEVVLLKSFVGRLTGQEDFFNEED